MQKNNESAPDYGLQHQVYLTYMLDEASKKYYRGEDSGISDEDFDMYMHELMELEEKNGQVFPNSPTKRVGSDIQDGFKKGKHPSPMLTINNTYNDDGLQEWVDKTHKMLLEWNPSRSETYLIGTKFDGVSLELHYHDCHLVQALTRGDKMVGDDVTENAKTILDIPIDLVCSNGDIYVRGEVMLPKSRLDAINKEREANGEEKFSNARNACTGSLKQLDPKITKQRGLIFRAWDLLGYEAGVDTMEDKLYILQNLGFNIGEVGPMVCTFNDVVSETTKMRELLLESGVDYDYDGIVVKINETDIQENIGTKDTRAIEWGIARKWNDKVVETVLLDVDWQVGRTGVLTPVARLEPVECGGVTVTNATLHNLGFIRKNDIMKYDWLKIVRSGDVIPYIEGVDLDLREGGVRYHVESPVKCPICGGNLEYEGELIKCTNVDCSAQITGKILQFCSKDCMDIKTIGEKVVEDLVATTLVKNYWDLYRLKEYMIGSLVNILGQGYGELSVNKMINAIEQSKKRPFENVLAALSIPGVGKVTGRLLANHFKTIDCLANATVIELLSIDGIGAVMVKDIYDWFHSDFGQYSVKFLKENGFNISVEESIDEIPYRPLDDLKICFTGKSERFSGDEVEDFLESLGAKCGHSVSGALNYLIIGLKPGGSKVKKAEDLGVEIISEKEFYEKFGI